MISYTHGHSDYNHHNITVNIIILDNKMTDQDSPNLKGMFAT